MSGMDEGILPFALLCQALRLGGPVTAFAMSDFGVFEPWARPLVTTGAPPRGRQDSEIAAAIPDSPRDLLYEVRTCLHALIAIRAGDRELRERLYAALLPARDELAGAGSGLLTLDPVAHYLSGLAGALDRPDEAAAHRRSAVRILARSR
jgi:hypothetical protein